MSTIAIIPARGGSTRIPRKNIRPFCGKPMIARSIEAAFESGVFDAVVVSTDDKEIASIAESFGAQVPFLRPAELSNDHAATLPVIAHSIRWWEQNRASVEFACCIYATAPFLRAEFLREGFQILKEKPDAEFAFSVTSYAFPIFRAIRVAENGRVEMFWPENQMKRSQDLPEAWHDAGQFYWGRKSAFLETKGVFTAESYPVILPRHLVQDIDTPEDWERAERMFAAAFA
ncbi:MAG: pseudaminic acid cytidylyltransferase [Verrucomicrobia bacterium]|nr:pseudaminic acid cytidylyltransferase [Verrucomicrobiota bacterium]